MSQQHLIGKTVLELDIGDLADVWSLQEETSRLFQQRALPEIERLFDRLVSNDQVVRFDQIVIDVGTLDRQVLADEFLSNLLTALHQTLSDALLEERLGEVPIITSQNNDARGVRRADRRGADWEVLLYFLQYGRFPWWVPAGSWQSWLPRWEAAIQNHAELPRSLQPLIRNSTTVQQRLIEQFPEAFRQQLILQMQPSWAQWSSLLTQARHLMQRLGLTSSVVQELERQAWRSLFLQLPTDAANLPLPTDRWMQDWLESLGQAYEAEVASDVLDQNPNLIHQRLRDSLATLASNQSLWQTALDRAVPSIAQSSEQSSEQSLEQSSEQSPEQSLEQSSEQSSEQSLEQSSEQSPEQSLEQSSEQSPEQSLEQSSEQSSEQSTPRSDLEVWLTFLQDGRLPIDSPDLQTWLPRWESLTQADGNWRQLIQMLLMTNSAARSRWVEQFPESFRQQSRLQLQSSGMDDEFSEDAIAPRSSRDRTSSLSPEEQESGIYVTQAGLVLLHPFLSFYFEGIGLLEGDSFRDARSQQSAIYLLYYLATQETDAPESELVLPKLLCGWSLDEPVVRGMEVSIEALQEGERLLQTVIDYWEVLRSTSPDGLREGFLQRPGKLTCDRDRNWTLRVEQSAIDVLLGRLPWGLSMVKLPWMEDLLTVEWT